MLDPTGASMPTLSAIPGTSGYLLAYEKRPRAGGGDVVRIRYYPSLFWLLGGQWAAQRDLPLTFSPYNDGTPTILWVHWNGGLSRSAIGLGFHYETATARQRGPDREAVGTLRGFRTWTAHTDPATDGALDRQGLLGSHGDWRQFSFERRRLAALRGPDGVQRLRRLAGDPRQRAVGPHVPGHADDRRATGFELVRESRSRGSSRLRGVAVRCSS